MRGWYELRSKQDSRFNKRGNDFICPYRGALNFDRYAWVQKQCIKYNCDPPEDLKYFIFWHGEEHDVEPF